MICKLNPGVVHNPVFKSCIRTFFIGSASQNLIPHVVLSADKRPSLFSRQGIREKFFRTILSAKALSSYVSCNTCE